MNNDAAIIALLQTAELFISTVALGELFAGAEGSGRVQENLEQIEKLASSIEVIECEIETARYFGKIR